MSGDTPRNHGQATSCRRDKLALAQVVSRTPWSLGARAIERKLGLMRVFNYHGTPSRYRMAFGRQIDHLLHRYEVLDPHLLEEALATGPPNGRPVAFFTFDDGLQNHYTVAAPELERRGLRGIFCLPVAFLSVPVEEQAAWFQSRIRPTSDAEHADQDDLLAMNWDEARALIARGHRICCHSLSHEVLTSRTSDRVLSAEIPEARHQLEEKLEAPVSGFCWPVTRDRSAAAALRLIRANYNYALVDDTQPLRKGHDRFDVNRTRLEASWPREAVDFQISGIMDALFFLRRKRGGLVA